MFAVVCLVSSAIAVQPDGQEAGHEELAVVEVQGEKADEKGNVNWTNNDTDGACCDRPTIRRSSSFHSLLQTSSRPRTQPLQARKGNCGEAK